LPPYHQSALQRAIIRRAEWLSWPARVHTLERRVELLARRVPRLLRKSVPDLLLTCGDASHHSVREFVHVHSEGMETGATQIRIDGRRDDLDHFNRRIAELVPK
jgi:hypothetical protein